MLVNQRERELALAVQHGRWLTDQEVTQIARAKWAPLRRVIYAITGITLLYISLPFILIMMLLFWLFV